MLKRVTDHPQWLSKGENWVHHPSFNANRARGVVIDVGKIGFYIGNGALLLKNATQQPRASGPRPPFTRCWGLEQGGGPGSDTRGPPSGGRTRAGRWPGRGESAWAHPSAGESSVPVVVRGSSDSDGDFPRRFRRAAASSCRIGASNAARRSGSDRVDPRMAAHNSQ